MNYNLLIGGAAGQGMDTLSSTLSKILQRRGYQIFTLQDYMSRVRGGHNFFQIRFSDKEVHTHREDLDGIIAFNQETLDLHIARLNEDGFILADEDIKSDDPRLITLPSREIAKEIGNPRVQSSVILGALLKLYTFDTDDSDVEEDIKDSEETLHIAKSSYENDLKFLNDIMSNLFNEEIVNQNVEAFNQGHELVESKYEIKSGSSEKTMLIQANEAIALGALAGGLKFYSAYPMTPATSIMSYLVRKQKDAEIIVEQAEDELAAINMAIGGSYAGARSMTGTSGGGYSLMVEAVGMSGIMEVPVVIADIQRPGPATGLPTRTEQSDLNFVINSSHGEFPRMVIALRNPEDAFYQTARALNLADKYQIPVIILGDQYMADAIRTVKPFDMSKIKIERHLANPEDYMDGKKYRRYELTESGISPRLIPGQVPGVNVNVDSDEHDEDGNITESAEVRNNMVHKRAKKFELLRKEVMEPKLIGEDNMDVLLLAWGSVESPITEAIELLNKDGDLKYGALVFGDIWPLPTKLLKEKYKNAKHIINVEQNYNGQLKNLISQETGIRVTGSVNRYDGRPLSQNEIYKKVKEVL